MPKGIQAKGLVREGKMIHAGIRLFLENGYENTTTASIARAVGMSPASFFATFENKEALLLKLVKQMFAAQFAAAGEFSDENEPLSLYAAETTLQLYIAESSDVLRELYVTAYSLPTTTRYIYDSMLPRLVRCFGSYLPGALPDDFRELEIASAGITRGFMAEPCTIAFPMEKKIRRYLNCCLTLYAVPADKQKEVIERAVQLDLRPVAERLVQDAIRQSEENFQAAVKASDEYKARRAAKK